MRKTYLSGFVVSATLALALSACRDVEPCVECLEGSAAVRCYTPFPQIICSVDQTTAAASCLEAGGTWAPATVCPAPIQETGDDGNQTWDPSLDVTYDRESGEYVVDQIAFEELKLEPSPLREGSTQLRALQSGYYEVATAGELANALGWQTGDVLLSVDGHAIRGLSDFAAAYTELADNMKFALTVKRGRSTVVLHYRVE